MKVRMKIFRYSDIQIFRKDRKVNVTGTAYDIGDRNFNTHNNGNMAAKAIKVCDRAVN